MERKREIGSIFLETLNRRTKASFFSSLDDCPFTIRDEMARCRGDTWFIRGRSCAPTTLSPATPRERRSFLMERARWPRCSREKWSREREGGREGRGCVALIEAGEKQVYENRKRCCNRARKLPEKDESSSFLTRRSTGVLPILSKDEYLHFAEGSLVVKNSGKVERKFKRVENISTFPSFYKV